MVKNTAKYTWEQVLLQKKMLLRLLAPGPILNFTIALLKLNLISRLQSINQPEVYLTLTRHWVLCAHLYSTEQNTCLKLWLYNIFEIWWHNRPFRPLYFKQSGKNWSSIMIKQKTLSCKDKFGLENLGLRWMLSSFFLLTPMSSRL